MSLFLLYLNIKLDVNTTQIPSNKSAVSPTPAVEDKPNTNFKTNLTTTIKHPPRGPKTNPPKIAGRLENCTSKKDGKNGSGNFGNKYKIKLSAEKIATFEI